MKIATFRNKASRFAAVVMASLALIGAMCGNVPKQVEAHSGSRTCTHAHRWVWDGYGWVYYAGGYSTRDGRHYHWYYHYHNRVVVGPELVNCTH
jgi:hypothetical protein